MKIETVQVSCHMCGTQVTLNIPEEDKKELGNTWVCGNCLPDYLSHNCHKERD